MFSLKSPWALFYLRAGLLWLDLSQIKVYFNPKIVIEKKKPPKQNLACIRHNKKGSAWHRRVWGCWRIAPLLLIRDPDLGHVRAQHEAALNPFTLTFKCIARTGKPPPLCLLWEGWGEKACKEKKKGGAGKKILLLNSFKVTAVSERSPKNLNK